MKNSIVTSGVWENGKAFKQRQWLIDFWPKFVCKHLNDDVHNVWMFHCCTGSGKTIAGFETIIQNIKLSDEKGENSIHGFVTPRILLSDQQEIDFINYFKRFYPDLYERTAVRYINSGERVNDENENNPNRVELASHLDPKELKDGYIFSGSKKHCVVVFCYASFKNSDFKRTHAFFKKSVSKAKAQGKKAVCGALVLDESHNYKKFFNILTGYQKKGEIFVDFEKDNFRELFNDVVLMTGTPAEFQCQMADNEKFKDDFVCDVTYKMAIEGEVNADGVKEPWILSPEACAVITAFDEEIYWNAIISIYLREKALHPTEPIHMCVNSVDRPTANKTAIMVNEYRKKHNLNLKVFCLHCSGDGLEPMEDGIQKPDSYIKARICGGTVKPGTYKGEKYEGGEFKGLDEDFADQDVIVFQVAMISEGINVNSFNAVVITRHAEISILQQIGRGVRKCKGKSHVCVYAICNEDDLSAVFFPLMRQGLKLGEFFKGLKRMDELKPTKPYTPSQGGSDDEKFVASDWDNYADIIVNLEREYCLNEDKDFVKRSTHQTNGIIFNFSKLGYPFIGKHISGILGNKPSTTKDKPSTNGNEPGNTTEENKSTTPSKSSSERKKHLEELNVKKFIAGRIRTLVADNPQWTKDFIPNMDDPAIVHMMYKEILTLSGIVEPNEFAIKLMRSMVNLVVSNNKKYIDEAIEDEAK